MGIGFFQLLIILLIILILFGRGKLPALAEDLGKSIKAFKKGMDGEKTDSSSAEETDADKKE
ncbi:MAG: twin-arginine translocase TatA/TatE family subunit [Alphaproteobacteria bacterium]|nr:twin-arginine translocase TatA/TatE family subunit [Alphaproteobacteria bacterium]